ncbi:unnamed protein product [Adineta steineri]|uniref:Uncharacterized protein n=1 Tax=Adineta steineri TaxID=433720 RepID=A0A814E257_9BILA|nr:unnamed protein product [Adineta steineri]CAF0963627.1 unnamed protein product [Adineta steineri]
MVSCEPFQSYKVPLKNNGQSIIEHNLVTIYLNLEWPDNINDNNPNLIIHIFDKKISPKPCKTETSMSYFQQNQSSLLVNPIHHQQQHPQQNFGSSYQQQQQQYYHHSSANNNNNNNEPPSTTTTTTTLPTGDHNDVSSTTTTVVFNSLSQPPSSSSSSSSTTTTASHPPIQHIKTELKTQLSPIYRRQQTPNSPPTCSSTNQQYLSSQHVIQTPSSDMDTQSNIQMAPISKSISSTSLSNIQTKQTLIHTNDLQQSSSIPSYPLSTSSAASTFKAFVPTCSKPHLTHEQNCSTMTLIKQQPNATLTAQTIVCRPPINRTIAQRAAVASQIRTNRSISMTPIKEQGQTSSTISLPFSISNIRTSDSPPNITTIVSQQQTNFPTMKKPIIRQRSTGSVNPRQRKKRITKQTSIPNAINHDQSSFYNQINLNDSKQQQQQSAFMIEEDQLCSPTPTLKSPTVKLVSPFSIQTTVSNTEIDQTIEDVINGHGNISINDTTQLPTKFQLQQQPSSQLVWVQNGTVTTKTWLSPLYQKQQQQQQQQQQLQQQQQQQQQLQQQQQQQQQSQSDYDPIGSTLTHQDVVNIAQQVVFPTNNEQNQMNTVLQTPLTANSKKRNRSKSTTNVTLKRNRNRKPLLNRPHSAAITSPRQEIIGKSTTTSPITPTLNLINKPISWSNIPTPSGFVTTTTNPPPLNSNQHLPSFDKNDSWQPQCVENVDSMLDEFQLVSIDEQRINSNHQFDFDLSTDGFSSKTNDQFTSSTPPPPPTRTNDNQRFTLSSTDKLTNSSITNSRLGTGDVDVYEHFLNPYSSSIWQENQVTSSVSTPPDFQINTFSMQHQQQQAHLQQQQQQHHHHHHQQQQQQQHHHQQQQQTQQQYYSSQINDEHFDPYNLQSQATKKK